MSTRNAAAMIALLAVLGASACGRNAKKGERPIDVETPVHVENHNWLDVVVYAVRSGTRVRLGDVPTGRTVSFVLPRGFTTGTSIRLVADPIGGSATYSTDPLSLGPGHEVQLRLENNLRLSSVSVR